MGKYENGQYKTDSELDADRRASVEGMSVGADRKLTHLEGVC
jgi:hypothetical protein